MQGPEAAWQARVSLRVDDPCAQFALAVPRDTQSVQWRFDMQSKDTVHGMRILVHGTAVQGEWDGAAYVAHTHAAPAIEAQWLDAHGSVGGSARVYMHK